MIRLELSLAGAEPELHLFTGESISFGREADNDLVMPAASVSARHGKISQSHGGYVVEDVGSTNGIIVDGRKLSAPTTVAYHGELSVAAFRIRLLAPEGSDARPDMAKPAGRARVWPWLAGVVGLSIIGYGAFLGTGRLRSTNSVATQPSDPAQPPTQQTKPADTPESSLPTDLSQAIAAAGKLGPEDRPSSAANLELRRSLGERRGWPWQAHEGSISAIAFTHDDRRIVSAGSDGVIRLWARYAPDAGGQPIELRSHSSAIRYALTSSDGRWLVTSGAESSPRKWDLRQRDPSASLVLMTGHESPVTAMAMSGDGGWLVSASEAGRVRLWDLNTRQSKGTWIGPKSAAGIVAVAIDHTGQRIATADGQGRVRVDFVEAGQVRQTIANLELNTHAVEVMSFGAPARLMVGRSDGQSTIWNLSDRRTPAIEASISGHPDAITAVAINPSGTMAVSASADGSVRIRELSADVAGTLEWNRHQGLVSALEFASLRGPDGNSEASTVSSASWDRSVFVWDVDRRNLEIDPIELAGHDTAIQAMAASHDGQWLVTGDAAGQARLWDFRAREADASSMAARGHSRALQNLVLDASGARMLTASRDHSVGIWHIGVRGVPQLIAHHRGHNGAVTALQLRGDGRLAASASVDGEILLWDPQAPAARNTPLRGHEGEVHQLQMSANGRWLASAASDLRLRLWHLADGLKSTALEGHENVVSVLEVDARSRWLLSGDHDGRVFVWSLAAGHAPKSGVRLNDGPAAIVSARLGSEGRFAAALDENDRVQIWDLRALSPDDATLAPIFSVNHPHSRRIAFSHDGRQLASAGTTINIWDLARLDDAAPLVLARAGAELTQLEFTPQGDALITGDEDGQIHLWPLQGEMPQQPVRLAGHDRGQAITAMAWAGDGSFLATASGDRSARIWPMTSKALRTAACRALGMDQAARGGHFLWRDPTVLGCPTQAEL